MAAGDQESEYGEGRGRTGYVRPLRAYEEMRLMRATDPADPSASIESALTAELLLEQRTRTDEPLRRGGQAE
jgi:hypothetical protein